MLDKFEKMLGYSFSDFFTRVTTFLSYSVPKLEDFYTGRVDTIDTSIFQELDYLEKQVVRILSMVQDFKESVNGTLMLELIGNLEDVDLKLKTVGNMTKWLRCTYDSMTTGRQDTITVEVNIGKNQSLESVLRRLGIDTPWQQIAQENQLSEKDYQILEGNRAVKIKSPYVRSSVALSSIVDLISSESIYGKDIDQTFSFSDGDITTVTGTECIEQAVSILISLKKNDNPINPGLGIQSELLVGTNRNLLNLPITQRQIRETILTDDTLRNFEITKTVFDEDKLLVDWTVETINGSAFSSEK